MDFLKHLQIEPVQFVWGAIAIFGGVARYLNGITQDGLKFRFSIFLASAFVAGFSGYMFALLGLSLNFPFTMISIMAGTGGFFGEQTMKLIMEYFGQKVSPAPNIQQ